MNNDSILLIIITIEVIVLVFIFFKISNLPKIILDKVGEKTNSSLEKQNEKFDEDIMKITEKLIEQDELSKDDLYNKIKELTDGLASSFYQSFDPLKENFNTTLDLLKGVARTDTRLQKKNTFIIGSDNILEFLKKTSYQDAYNTAKKLDYWKKTLENISDNYEMSFINKLKSIFKSDDFFILNNRAVLVTPWSQRDPKTYIEQIKNNLIFLEEDNIKNSKKANGLSIKNVDFYDQIFVQNRGFSDEENAFLSNNISAIKQNIKIIENSSTNLLKTWKLIETSYNNFYRDIIAYVNENYLKKNEDDNNSNFLTKVKEFESSVNEIENRMIKTFYELQIIKAYNNIYSSKKNFEKQIKDNSFKNEKQILEWGEIYNNILSVFEEFMNKNLNIIKINTKPGDKFSENMNFSIEPAVYVEDIENETILEIQAEGFQWKNGKVIVKSKVLISTNNKQ